MFTSSTVHNDPKGLRSAAKPGSSGQRGTIGILAAISFPVLVSIAGLAILMGILRTERTDLQSLADAATLAGASCLIPNAICGNSGYVFPDFTGPYGATAKANSTIDGYDKNLGRDIKTGYFNLADSGSQSTLCTTKTCTSDTSGQSTVPVIRVTLSRTNPAFTGPFKFFFAFVGSPPAKQMTATATSGPSSPRNASAGATKGALFPIIMAPCVIETYWDKNANKPNVDETGKPKSIYLSANNNDICNSPTKEKASVRLACFGTDKKCSANELKDLLQGASLKIDYANPAQAYLPTGTKDSIWTAINNCSEAGSKDCNYVRIPVAKDELPSGNGKKSAGYVDVSNFACVHIVSASKEAIVLTLSNDPQCRSKTETIVPGAVNTTYGVNMVRLIR